MSAVTLYTLTPPPLKRDTGLPGSEESTNPWDPTVDLCLGPSGDIRGLAFSYERGNHVV